jgi:DnaJ-class molecular chaperone
MTEQAKPQVDKFKELARELGADEDEKAFEDQVRRIAGGAERRTTCRHCQGDGKVPKAQDIVPAAYAPDIEYEPCAKCQGTGTVAG